MDPELAKNWTQQVHMDPGLAKNWTQQVDMDPGLAKNWTQQVYMNLDLTLEPDLVVPGLGCSSQSQKPTGNTYKITRKITSLI